MMRKKLLSFSALALVHSVLFCLPVGAGLAFLSAIDRTVAAGVPYPDAERLFRLRQLHPEVPGGVGDFSSAQVEQLRASIDQAELVVGVKVRYGSLQRLGKSARVRLAIVSPEYLSLLAGTAVPEASIRAQGAYVSRELWSRQFGDQAASRDDLASLVDSPRKEARTLVVDGTSFAVLGLLPDVPLYPIAADVLVFDDVFPQEKYDRTSFYVAVLVKARKGDDNSWRAQLESAREDLGGMADFERERLSSYRFSVASIRKDLAGEALSLLGPLQLSAAGLLVLGVFNSWAVWSTHLLRRRTELATRMALGASRRQLRRRFVLLATGLTLTAIVVGIGVALLLIPPLRGVLEPLSVRHDAVGLSALAVGLVGGIALMLGLVAAMLAWSTTVLSASAALGGSRGVLESRPRTGVGQRLTLVVQGGICCCLVLLGLGASSELRERRAEELGFSPGATDFVSVALPEPPYDDPKAVLALVSRALAGELGEIAVSTSAPLAGEFVHAWLMRVETIGSNVLLPTAIETRAVSANYFSVIGASFRRGESFGEATHRDQFEVPVVVNQALVERYWPGDEELIGRHFSAKQRSFYVVGVVDDIREKTLTGQMEPVLYVPYSVRPSSELTFVRDGTSNPRKPASLARWIVAEEPSATILEASTLRLRYRNLISFELSMAGLFGSIATLAFFMFAAGVLAEVTTRAVSQARSYAIRAALGSSLRSLYWRLTRPSAGAVALGVAGGMGLAVALGRSVRGFILPEAPLWMSLLSALVLVGVALIAGLVSLAKLSVRKRSARLMASS